MVNTTAEVKPPLTDEERRFLEELESAARLIREGVWTARRAASELRNVSKDDGSYWLP